MSRLCDYKSKFLPLNFIFETKGQNEVIKANMLAIKSHILGWKVRIMWWQAQIYAI